MHEVNNKKSEIVEAEILKSLGESILKLCQINHKIIQVRSYTSRCIRAIQFILNSFASDRLSVLEKLLPRSFNHLAALFAINSVRGFSLVHVLAGPHFRNITLLDSAARAKVYAKILDAS